MQFFSDIRLETVGGKVRKGRLQPSAQDSAGWRNVLNAPGVSLTPGLWGIAVTSRAWTLLWDRGAVAKQTMSSSHPERSSGKRRLRPEKELDCEEQEGALNTEGQGHQHPLAALICEAHGHFYWSLCRFAGVTPPAGLAPTPAPPGTLPKP